MKRITNIPLPGSGCCGVISSAQATLPAIKRAEVANRTLRNISVSSWFVTAPTGLGLLFHETGQGLIALPALQLAPRLLGILAREIAALLGLVLLSDAPASESLDL
jgi:hypothetical protein